MMLLYIEWINNRILLYSTGNCIQYPVINHNEKEFLKECIYMCVCVYIYIYMLCVCVCVCVCVCFPDSSVGKESACNAGDPGLIPESGRSSGEGLGYPFQYSWLLLWLSW